MKAGTGEIVYTVLVKRVYLASKKPKKELLQCWQMIKQSSSLKIPTSLQRSQLSCSQNIVGSCCLMTKASITYRGQKLGKILIRRMYDMLHEKKDSKSQNSFEFSEDISQKQKPHDSLAKQPSVAYLHSPFLTPKINIEFLRDSTNSTWYEHRRFTFGHKQ